MFVKNIRKLPKNILHIYDDDLIDRKLKFTCFLFNILKIEIKN